MLTSGWIGHARRLGRIVIFAVLACGVGIAAAGLVRTIAPAIVLLAMAGYADGVSALCRSTINQTVTPDALRGPRLGDIESGLVAGLTSAMPSVVSGGLACVVGVGAVFLAFPDLVRYDEHEAARLNPPGSPNAERLNPPGSPDAGPGTRSDPTPPAPKAPLGRSRSDRPDSA